jgi:Macrocin-O-methyltransferase (TylF)
MQTGMRQPGIFWKTCNDQGVPGGRLQIDDYGYWSGCRQAVSEFEAARRLKFEMHVIDETGVWQ